MKTELAMNTALETVSEAAVAGAWETVCRMDDLLPNVGACALVAKHHQVALFRVSDGEQVFAIANYDPKSGANVLSRGIIGDVKGELVVASPLYKHHYSLLNGRCLEDQHIQVPTYKVRVKNNSIQVALP